MGKKKKAYDEISVVRILKRKRSITIDTVNRSISVTKGADDCGNGTWGKIDFLCHYCGYHWLFKAKSEPKVNAVKTNDSEPERINKTRKTPKGLKVSKKLLPLRKYAEV